jgi:predicted MFS family arabinose efflux permease
MVAATILAVTGFFAAFTYVSPFLTKVAGFARHDVAPVLVLTGLASLFGVLGVGMLYRRRPRAATVAPVALLAASAFAVYVFATDGAVAVVFIALDSLALGGIALAMQTGVLVVAPRGTDIASAWFSASFNVGIASGPVVGALTLSTLGLRSTPLVAALLVTAAVAVLLAGSRSPRRAPPPAATS